MVDEIIKSGIKPIVFDYNDVVFFKKEFHVARTFMKINSLELGLLSEKEYRFVARRTEQGVKMVKRHIERLIRLIPRHLAENPGVECFMIPVYPKLVLDSTVIGILYDTFAIYSDVHPSKVCIEISSDILYEDITEVKARLAEIRDLGCKVAISEVGDEYCPAFKLSELDFDMVLLDRFSIDKLNRPDAERVLGGTVKYLHNFGVPVIAPDLDTEEQISMAKLLECDGYTATGAEPLFKEPEPEIPEEEPAEEPAETPAEPTAEEPAEPTAETAETPTEETPTEETPAEETPAEEPTAEEAEQPEEPAEEPEAEPETEEEPEEVPAEPEEPAEPATPAAERMLYLAACKKARKEAEAQGDEPERKPAERAAYRIPTAAMNTAIARREARRASARGEGKRESYRERIAHGHSTERRR
jgi:EAL domain-containing protein (putative c-di-GMP-specific phosphodiesterase class I)